MAYQFIPDENGPHGMGRIVDETTGLDRVVYDPDMADRVASGEPLGLDDEERLQDAAPAPGDAFGAPAIEDPTAPPQSPTGLPPASPQPPPGPAPIVRASGNPPPPPAAPPGTVMQKAEVVQGTPGYTYDKAAEEERHERLADRTTELNTRRDAAGALLADREAELSRQKREDEAAHAVEVEKAQRYERELNTTVAKELDPDRLVKTQGIGGTVLGLVGMALAAFSKSPGPAMARLNQSLDRQIAQDIEIQKQQKDSMVSNLTRQLGSAQQAESHFRASVRGLALDRLENNLKAQGVDAQYSDLIQAARDDVDAIDANARAASYGKPGTAKYTFGQPKPGAGAGGVALNNPTVQELKGLGISQDAWTKGLNGKVVAGENSPTITQAVTTTKQIDSDIATLDALAAANGGTLPKKGVINIPDVLVRPLSALGYKPGMQAEEVNQLVNKYVNQQARSYGGAITDSDRDAAEKETGQTTEGTMRYLEGLRKKNNDAVAAALTQQFPGVGQKALDILLREAGGTKGIPRSKIKPFDAHNGPAATASPADPSAPGAPAEGADPLRDIKRKGLASYFFGDEGQQQAPGSAM